jgi:predicted MPP superfamily phosphohydrolase
LLASASGTLAAGMFGYGVGFEPRRVAVTRRTVALPNLPASLDGLRLVQLTDLHHGPWISIGAIRSFVRRTNELSPDLVLLTGDYVHRSPAYIEPVAAALAGLRASIGVVGVLGNHDWWENGPLSRRALERAGVVMLDNTRGFVTPDRALVAAPVDRGLCLAGVGDYYEDEQRYADALGGVSPDVPRLLLSHNPDVAEDRAFRRSGLRVDVRCVGAEGTVATLTVSRKTARKLGLKRTTLASSSV